MTSSNGAMVVHGARVLESGMDLQQMGTMMAQSGFFSDTREAAQAAVKIQAGAELGFPPVASMTGIHIIKGKVGISANLMAAALKRYDKGKYNYRVVDHSPTVCDIEFFEGGQSVGHSVFTLQDAQKAGTQNLDKFPRNMLFARAMSNGVKWFCPDVFGGPIYTPDELGAKVNEDGEVLEPTPPPPAQRETPKAEPKPAKDKPLTPRDELKLAVAAWSQLKPEDIPAALQNTIKAAGLSVAFKSLTDGQAAQVLAWMREKHAAGLDFLAAIQGAPANGK